MGGKGDRDRDYDDHDEGSSKKVIKTKSVTINKSSDRHEEGISQAGGETIKNIMNIILIVFLTLVTLAFVYMFAKNPVLVITLSCVFIMLYAVMILYMINKVSSEDGFSDNTVTRILRWSTMTVLIMAIMIAVATLLGAKAKDMIGKPGPQRVAQPQQQQQQPQQPKQQQQQMPKQQQPQRQQGQQNRQQFQPQQYQPQQQQFQPQQQQIQPQQQFQQFQQFQ